MTTVSVLVTVENSGEGLLKTPKVSSYRLMDDDGRGEIAIVRCPENDNETFYKHASQWMSDEGIDHEEFYVNAPEWRLYRMNPCNDGEHSWDIGRPKAKGPGNWMGAIVKVTHRPKEEIILLREIAAAVDNDKQVTCYMNISGPPVTIKGTRPTIKVEIA